MTEILLIYLRVLNLKIIGSFIITYIDYINDSQNIYDELTKENVDLKVASDNQKAVTNTLKTFEWLNQDADLNKLTIYKMRLNKITYANIHYTMQQQFGVNFLDENNDMENTDILIDTDNTEYARENDNENDWASTQIQKNVDGDGDGDGDGDDDDYNIDKDNINKDDYNNIDKYEINNDLPFIMDVDDMDDMDMDYDFIGVNED